MGGVRPTPLERFPFMKRIAPEIADVTHEATASTRNASPSAPNAFPSTRNASPSALRVSPSAPCASPSPRRTRVVALTASLALALTACCGNSDRDIATVYLPAPPPVTLAAPQLASVTRSDTPEGAILYFQWSAPAAMWQGALHVRLVCDAGSVTVMPEWVGTMRMQVVVPGAYAYGTCQATIEPLPAYASLAPPARTPVHIRFDRGNPYGW